MSILSDNKRILYFDLETQKLAADVGGWGHVRDMKLALGIVFDSQSGKFLYFEEAQVLDLVAEFQKADLIVGFNVKRFDYEVLRGYTDFDFLQISTFDILEMVHQQLGFRLSLDHLSECTLKKGKGGDGLKAVQWFREGRMDLIKTYCEQDVLLTKELFEFGVKNEYLLFKDKKIQQLVRLPFRFEL